MTTYFISYSHQHQPSRDLLGELLFDLNKDCVVHVDRNIPLGSDWDGDLGTKVAASDVFLLLLSDESVGSGEVRKEVRRALEQRTETGRPLIIPIYTQDGVVLDQELQLVVPSLQHFVWTSDAHTPKLLKDLRQSVAQFLAKTSVPTPPPRLPPRRVRNAAIILLALFFTFFVLPWAVSRWLDWRAEQMFARDDRYKVDDGLLASATAALIRMGKPVSQANDAYRNQNYDRLVATLSADKNHLGSAIAVASGEKWRIVDGNQLWTCTPGRWKCEVRPFSDETFKTAAITAPDTVRVLQTDGRLHQFVFGESIDHPTPTAGVESLAAEGAVVAYTVPIDETHSRIRVEAPGVMNNVLPDRPAKVKTLAFGPCRGCFAMLETDDGGVFISDGAQRVTEMPAASPAIAIATSSSSSLLAVLRADHKLVIYRMRAFGDMPEELPAIDAGAEIGDDARLSISADGAYAAIVYDGRLLLIARGTPPLLLVDGESPGVSAAAFAGPYLVSRTADDVRIWTLEPSKEQRELGPMERWLKWRQQIRPAPIVGSR